MLRHRSTTLSVMTTARRVSPTDTTTKRTRVTRIQPPSRTASAGAVRTLLDVLSLQGENGEAKPNRVRAILTPARLHWRWLHPHGRGRRAGTGPPAHAPRRARICC